MPLIHGIDVGGYLKAIRVNNFGHVLIQNPIEVKGTNTDKLLSLVHRLNFYTFSITLAAGTNNLAVFTVPAGLYYHVTNMGLAYVGTVLNVILQLNADFGGTAQPVESQYGLTTTQFRYRTVDWWFEPADTLTFSIYNATLNDAAYCSLNGYILHTT
jgi:hypothetical protein